LDPSACRFGRAGGFRVGDPEDWQLHAGVAFWIDRSLVSPGLGASVGGIFFACGSEPIELDSSWIRAEMPDSLRRVREVQNQRMHGLQIQMNIISQHTNGVFLSVNGMICSHCHATIQMALLAAGIRLEMI
jgi:hypothetical protein